jgi:alpha-methylacyl-CoA racemase
MNVVALVTNIPGPIVASALSRDGASVVKVEPAAGDPLQAAAPAWYAQLTRGLDVRRADLRTSGAWLGDLLGEADVLVTSMRPGALERLELGWERVHADYPRLCHVAIFGEGAHDDRPGHDLTYQAKIGLVDPPSMPRSVFADLFGAQRALAQVYRTLYERERTHTGVRADVALTDAAELCAPLRHGLTAADGPLGGALPTYRIYRASDGWIALAALEPHFRRRLQEALNVSVVDVPALEMRFSQESCAQWERVAQTFDLPLCKVESVRG